MSVKSEVQASTAEEFWEILKVVIQALAIAFVVRIFLFQPFTIPSSSMEGTLLVGDYVFVSKYSYGFSKYSFAISGRRLMFMSLTIGAPRVLSHTIWPWAFVAPCEACAPRVP